MRITRGSLPCRLPTATCRLPTAACRPLLLLLLLRLLLLRLLLRAHQPGSPALCHHLPTACSRLLLADPPNRARHNRECFLDLLTEEERTAEFVVEESEEKLVRVWEGSPGSSSPGSSSSSSSGSDGRASWREVPIALMVLRRAASCDTVGVKLGW